ncbi:MAG: hypothetical protein JW861_02170 [Bacteroidales bacterium]|nr:hypothetical protein [Bacteroidales bacterium]
MKVSKRTLITFIVFASLFPMSSDCQWISVPDPYLQIHADADDPLYTTYSAAPERSRLYGDKAYKMDYYSDCNPIHFQSDPYGRFYHLWMIDKVVIDLTGKYYKKPVVTASFPDMAILEYEPVKGLRVRQCFLVYSSRSAMVDLMIRNESGREHLVEIYPILEMGNDSLLISGFDDNLNGYVTHHRETRERLISDLYAAAPYPTEWTGFFSAGFPLYSRGGFHGSIPEFYQYIKTDFYEEERSHDSLNFLEEGNVDFIALHGQFELASGAEMSLRYFRSLQGSDEPIETLRDEMETLQTVSLQDFLDANTALFKSIPRPELITEEEKLLYLGSFNLVRGCMLPPTGHTRNHYYVFSRNPIWGWGHGHQVLHESLSMLAYVYLDCRTAMESQRVFMEQQGEDGLIAYRHGPRGPQTYPHKGQPTTSAPFYNWINWELFRVCPDTAFLKDAYVSGTSYIDWVLGNRDKDRDGSLEWGPYGIIENVRDWYNVVFQVSKERYLDIDKEDISDELECLDLNLMVINEMRCLSSMAGILDIPEDSVKWKGLADSMSMRINEYMWDPASGFYYHVDMKNHSFRFMERDLRRQEIIGFLPLWAQATDSARAGRLIKALTDTTKFWREFGIPTLAADDPWYSPDVDYCCKWNGPVWMLWDYMVFDGLLKYGYENLALRLGEKMVHAASAQLRINHNFWESYSPDNTVLDCPSNYIWDAILAKILIELNRLRVGQ